MDYQIELLKISDWNRVREIYLEGLAAGNATFQTEAPSWEEWNNNHLDHSRLAARTEDNFILRLGGFKSGFFKSLLQRSCGS